MCLDHTQQDTERSWRRRHFVCQFNGCKNRCAGNHGLLVHFCPVVDRMHARCEKCGHARQFDERAFDFQCKQCSHIYCYNCSFERGL